MSRYKKTFLILFILFIVFNLSTLKSYGLTWDELAQQHLGKASLDYVFHNASSIKLLRDDLIYYGPFFEMINNAVAPSFERGFGLDPIVAFHVLIFAYATLGIFFLFKFVARLFDEKTALLSTALLMILPRFIAHAQYNSKDTILASSSIIVLYLLFEIFFDNKKRSLIWASIVIGLTLAVRVDAILIPVIFFLTYWLTSWKDFLKNLKNDVGKIIIFVSLGGLVTYIAWPALWHDPALFFRALEYFSHHGWEGKVLYQGYIYSPNALPWHYGFFYLFGTIPTIVSIFFMLGFYKLIRSLIIKENLFKNYLLLFWIFLRPLLDLLPDIIRYDGVRHYLFVLPPILIIASQGLIFFCNCLQDKFKNLKNGYITIFYIVVFVSALWQFVIVFPYGDVYFNELARLKHGSHLENNFDFDYWGSSYKEAISWINKNATTKSSFCVAIADHLIQLYPIRPDLIYSCDKKTNYLIVLTRKAYLPTDLDNFYNYTKSKPVFMVTREKSNLVEIYKLN
ncbi:MAG: glycosyltransferase [Parcubacteria group bacterium GW2011_GWC1_39_29]|nr:MAG: glycosyltransferase [Parcubacteria group bacterium GW2011_GWC1_39_29]